MHYLELIGEGKLFYIIKILLYIYEIWGFSFFQN